MAVLLLATLSKKETVTEATPANSRMVKGVVVVVVAAVGVAVVVEVVLEEAAGAVVGVVVEEAEVAEFASLSKREAVQEGRSASLPMRKNS